MKLETWIYQNRKFNHQGQDFVEYQSPNLGSDEENPYVITVVVPLADLPKDSQSLRLTLETGA